MYAFLTKNGQTLAFGIGFLVVLLSLIIIFSGSGEFAAIDDENNPARYDTTIFNFIMYAAAALVVLCALAAVLFGIYQVATDPKGALKGLLGLGIVVVVLLILYSSADPDTAMLAAQARDGFFVEPGESKFISGLILTALGMAGTAVVALAISEIISFFK